MAMYDWNHDGNNDWKDKFIEYQLYHMQQEEKSPVPTGRGNGMSIHIILMIMMMMSSGICPVSG